MGKSCNVYPLHYCRPGELASGFKQSIHSLEPYRQMTGMGVKLFQINATPTTDIYTGMCAWQGADIFDYSAQEEGWERVVELDPEAQLCFRLFLGSPVWWDAAHPGELQRGAVGETGFKLGHTDRTTVPSVASEKWREDSKRALVHFLNWLRVSGWEERVWGFLICAGITYEWGLLGGDCHPDTSEPMLRRFRAYLRETYATRKKFRVAWGDSQVEFETVGVPSLEQRRAGDEGLRIFPRDRAAYDFQRCLSVANAECLIDAACTIRTHGKCDYQIGAFYGYTLTAREGEGDTVRKGAGGLAGGHHALGMVLKERVLDYLASPYAYANRDLSKGTLVPHFPWTSVRHHGVKIYLENDLWAFTNPRRKKNNLSLGETFTREDSILHQRLAFGTALCRGESFWWFDLTHREGLEAEVSNYSDPGIREELARHAADFERLAGQAGPPIAEIALIIDEASKDALSLDSKNFLKEIYESLADWAWCGAPFDVWLAEDVSSDTMAPYRLAYVFAPNVAGEIQEQLVGALSSPMITVWLAPGTELPGLEGCRAVLREPCAGRSSEELASVAAAAGVHNYGVAPLQVWASRNLVMIHCRGTGTRSLHFPGGGLWKEHFSGTETEGRFDFQQNDVRLFVRL